MVSAVVDRRNGGPWEWRPGNGGPREWRAGTVVKLCTGMLFFVTLGFAVTATVTSLGIVL